MPDQNNKQVIDKSHIRLSYITHFYCNQDNIDSVTDLLKQYETYPAEILDVLQFVIVDDGSPVQYTIPQFNLNIIWLKITDDIQWNQAGARNLGVLYAKSDKIIITDLDHEIPPETLRYMINRHNPGRSFFKIYRTDKATGTFKKGHSNMFFMSRARFFRHFGYDEEFAGHYGAEDYRFVKYHKYHGSRQRYLPRRFRCFERVSINRDKAYHTLDRDLSYNTPVDARKKKEIDLYGAEHGHSRMFLNFNWKILAQINRAVPAPIEKKWWQPLWWFRYAFEYFAR